MSDRRGLVRTKMVLRSKSCPVRARCLRGERIGLLKVAQMSGHPRNVLDVVWARDVGRGVASGLAVNQRVAHSNIEECDDQSSNLINKILRWPRCSSDEMVHLRVTGENMGL